MNTTSRLILRIALFLVNLAGVGVFLHYASLPKLQHSVLAHALEFCVFSLIVALPAILLNRLALVSLAQWATVAGTLLSLVVAIAFTRPKHTLNTLIASIVLSVLLLLQLRIALGVRQFLREEAKAS